MSVERSNARTHECLYDDTLGRLVVGQVGDEERQRAESHIDGCGRCRRLITQIARLSLATRTQSIERLPDAVPEAAPLVSGSKLGRYLAWLRFGLAQASWRTQPVRALALARQAEQTYAHAPSGFAHDLAEVSAWLATRAQSSYAGAVR